MPFMSRRTKGIPGMRWLTVLLRLSGMDGRHIMPFDFGLVDCWGILLLIGHGWRFAPDKELPDIATILRNDPPHTEQGEIDSTLLRRPGSAGQSPAEVQLKMATVNVGTMDYHNQVEYGMAWKALELAKQFDEQNLHVIGVQECRARVSKRVTTGPYIRLIQAGVHGQAGVELWIHGRAFQRMFQCDFNADTDLTVWHSTERVLAVRCSVGAMQFDIVVLYAPQRGRTHHEMNRPQEVPLFILGDLNCRVGSVNDHTIGSHAGDLEDEAGSMLRRLCNELELMIPATFSHIHEGPSGTFLAHNGASSRIDYILVPQYCQHDVIRSYVDQHIDVMNGDRDHKPSVLEIKFHWKPHGNTGFSRFPFYDRDAARRSVQNEGPCLLDDVPPQDWDMDVNKHWTVLRQQMQQKVGKDFPKQKRESRDSITSNLTPGNSCVIVRSFECSTETFRGPSI